MGGGRGYYEHRSWYYSIFELICSNIITSESMTLCRLILVLRCRSLSIWQCDEVKCARVVQSCCQQNSIHTAHYCWNLISFFSSTEIWLRCDMIESNCSCPPIFTLPHGQTSNMLVAETVMTADVYTGDTNMPFFFFFHKESLSPTWFIKHLKCRSHKTVMHLCQLYQG